MGSITEAIILATAAHAGQQDKGGAPYILHPLRLMLQMDTDEARIVAVLHDVAEDCPEYTVDDLERQFGSKVGAALRAITKVPGESYETYLARVASDWLATKVKLADLEDNSRLSRLAAPSTIDLERVSRYATARQYLETFICGPTIYVRWEGRAAVVFQSGNAFFKPQRDAPWKPALAVEVLESGVPVSKSIFERTFGNLELPSPEI